MRLYWEWWKLFRKDWWTGNRIKFQPELAHEYRYLGDFGPLTIVIRRIK